MTASQLALTRPQILAFRRRVGALDERLPRGRGSLRRAAWAGLQDSMPRAALLSIHARVERTEPSTWEDPSLVQLWEPRYNVFLVERPAGLLARDAARRCQGATPISSGTEPTATSWSPTPATAPRSGHRACGPAACSSPERSPEHGGARIRC